MNAPDGIHRREELAIVSLDAPVLVRRSTWADLPSLKRLAALRETTKFREGVYLIAEVRNELVAAVPLAGRAPTLHDPELPNEDLPKLLRRWARNLRRKTVPSSEVSKAGQAAEL